MCSGEMFVAYNEGKKGSLELCEVCGTRNDTLSAMCGYFSLDSHKYLNPFHTDITQCWPMFPTLSVLLTIITCLKYDPYICCTDPITGQNDSQCNRKNYGGNAQKAIKV